MLAEAHRQLVELRASQASEEEKEEEVEEEEVKEEEDSISGHHPGEQRKTVASPCV